MDTSALAKRYLTEAGSAWVHSVTDLATGHTILIAELTSVEMFSLLARRVRERTLSTASAVSLESAFLLHAETEYLVLPQDSAVLAQARVLLKRHPLRALDAIQLASAQRPR